jgi:hypothetical protein
MNPHNEPKDGGIEQLRDILVGGAVRELDRKLARLEAHLGGRLTELQQEARRRIDFIEAHLRKEGEVLSMRFTAELAELKEMVRAMTRDDRDAKTSVEQRMNKLEETVARNQAELRNQILDQAKSFLDELHQTRAELADTIDREFGGYDTEPTEEQGSRELHEAAEDRSQH